MNVPKILSIAAIPALVVCLAAPAGAVGSGEAELNNKPPAAAETGGYLTLAPGQYGTSKAYCPSGTQVSGGGGLTGTTKTFITSSFAIDGQGWYVSATNIGTNLYSYVQAYALCK